MLSLLFLFLAQVNLPYSMFTGGAAVPSTPTPTPTPTPGTVVATPSINPSSGDQPLSVSITCATAGATIFYTLANSPGTTPSHSGASPQGSTLVYTSSFSVTGTPDKTVKALGYKVGLTDSAIATADYLGGGGGHQ